MKLSVHTHRGTLFEGEAVWVQVPCVTGYLTVLDRHEPMVAILQAGVLRWEDKASQTHTHAIVNGVLRTEKTQTTVVVDVVS